jgi:acetyl-CoA/propionyl-CoA carboxylase biotin carboxyl carrier protein
VTNLDFLRFTLADPDVVAGRLDTGLLDRRVGDFAAATPTDDHLIAAAAYRWLCAWHDASNDLWTQPSGWRVGGDAPTSIRLRAGERTDHVRITGRPDDAVACVENGETRSLAASLAGSRLAVTLDGLRCQYLVAADDRQIWLAGTAGTAVVTEVREAAVRPDDEHSGDAELTSPMPGTVVAIGVDSPTPVTAGTVVVTVEAMKMEHALTAPIDGTAELLVDVGDLVKVGQPLARITAHPDEITARPDDEEGER